VSGSVLGDGGEYDSDSDGEELLMHLRGELETAEKAARDGRAVRRLERAGLDVDYVCTPSGMVRKGLNVVFTTSPFACFIDRDIDEGIYSLCAFSGEFYFWFCFLFLLFIFTCKNVFFSFIF
jgi:hypothetical protein